MGNCSLKGVVTGKGNDVIRIMTDSGGIMEMEGPVLVRTVISDYPGYGIFRQGHISSPLLHLDLLVNGHLYYLLPLRETRAPSSKITKELDSGLTNRVSSLRLSSGTVSDLVMNSTTTEPALEVLPSPGKGVWKVKLVIDTKQLEEILSEQVNTEALIEKMRTVASSANATPKRTKSSWRRPTFSGVCRMPPEDLK
ncbi:PREDICTED: uncharacterized protein LOC104604776 [Nelumbo nucifera]|uniref:Uncharacterized protein LOC104604776 n=2 Tax=Nelumbo nucifera TaxID=4432 RepID=A0A1U8AX40_NELNU|nr:PREDICTED: uncharacterized protein LOC104604776 [Nelumbo nucifera]DAD17919.1 TPA_asm: hypothetical protein HUJ06_019382 [Nelumbo nucifera]